MKMRKVFSSTVDALGHDEDTGELHVHWKKGRRSVYKDVSTYKADMVMNAASVGSALHEHIKNNPDHPHEYRE